MIYTIACVEIDVDAVLLGNFFCGSLGQRGDSCKRVDTQSGWHYGSVTNNQSLVNMLALASEQLAFVVDASA